MQLKPLLMPLLICLLSSCGSAAKQAPKVTVCVVDAANQACDCFNEATGKSFNLTTAQCDKYVAFPPTDAQTLLDFCGAPSGNSDLTLSQVLPKVLQSIR